MNFSCSKPDEDNDISFEFEADIKNSKKKTVELISSSVIILNKNEICAGGSGIDFIDAHIEPGEIERIEIATGWNHNASLFDNDIEQIKAIVNLSLLRRSFNKIGKLEVPNKKGASSFKKNICIDDTLNIYGAILERSEISEDGTVDLKINIGMINQTETYVPQVSVKTLLYDKDGDLIENKDDASEIPANSSKVFEFNYYSIKKGKLKNSYLEINAGIYFPVDCYFEQFKARLKDE